LSARVTGRTISYDGDPADVLVVGPAIENGRFVRGRILALMQMMDDGDVDSKIVIAPMDGGDRANGALLDADRDRLARFFSIYKQHQGKVTQVTGWGSAIDAAAFLRKTAGFFDAALPAR
jgi:inorganic pyrophosphatase